MALKVACSLVVVLFAILGAAQNTNPCKPEGGSYQMFMTIDESEAELGKEIFYVDIPGSASEVTLTSDYNEYFAFNASTRWVWVNGTIDAEISTESQTVTILCREIEGGGTVDISLTIIIRDSNDNGPVFTSSAYTVLIGEMTQVDTVIETTISATDEDASPNNNLPYYSILPGPYADYFVITNPLRASLTLLKPLDFETLPEFTITVMAEDRPTSGPHFNATCEVLIVVEDEDDQYPVFNSSVYRGFIASTASVNSAVNIQPAIAAYDPDASLRAQVVYSFHDPTGQSGELLSIDPNSAEVTLTSTPTSKEVYLLLQATQVDNPSRYGVALLAVMVQGSNVNAPVFARDGVTLLRTEAFPVGEVIANVIATDADPGSIIRYSIDEASKASFSMNENTGDITLRSSLSYTVKPQHVIKVTASDGTLQSTGQVTIQVSPVNNRPPTILTASTALNVSLARETGALVIDIDASSDGGTALSFTLLTYANLFTVDVLGRITVSAKADDLEQDVYQVALLVSDNGQPSYGTATAVTVNFPPLTTRVAGAQMAESDNVLPMILGAVAAVLLVVIIILTIYICRRRLRDKEHLDRAKKQLPSQDAKALAFKKQGTLGRQARVNIEFGQDPSDGETTVQENPLNSAVKGGYFNFGQVHSDMDSEADMNEIHVETSVTPIGNDDNNNDNIYNNSQMSEESEDYAPSDKQAITSFFRNGSLSTYRESSDSELSLNTSPTDSHDSKKNLVAGSSLARSHLPEEGHANGGHTVSTEDNLDPDASVVPTSQKQELTVYF